MRRRPASSLQIPPSNWEIPLLFSLPGVAPNRIRWNHPPRSLRRLTVTGNRGQEPEAKAGKANVVATAAGVAQAGDIFGYSGGEGVSVADMEMEVDDTARVVIEWKTKAPWSLHGFLPEPDT